MGCMNVVFQVNNVEFKSFYSTDLQSNHCIRYNVVVYTQFKYVQNVQNRLMQFYTEQDNSYQS